MTERLKAAVSRNGNILLTIMIALITATGTSLVAWGQYGQRIVELERRQGKSDEVQTELLRSTSQIEGMVKMLVQDRQKSSRP